MILSYPLNLSLIIHNKVWVLNVYIALLLILISKINNLDISFYEEGIQMTAKQCTIYKNL